MNNKFMKKDVTLLGLYPELSNEWNYEKNMPLTPDDVTPGSNLKVWWKLPYDDPKTGKHFDFEWQARIAGRALKGAGCPFLSSNGKGVWEGFNDLATTNPELVAEWNYEKNNPLKPTEISSGAGIKVWWKLPYDDPKTGRHFDFEWEATVASRAGGRGCPYLTNKMVYPGFNDLATTNPELVEEWNYEKNAPLKPTEISNRVGNKVWWIYPYDDPRTGKHFDFEWEATVASRTAGAGCPFLVNQRIYVGYNDLATTNPELAAEWNYEKNAPLKPTEVSESTGKKVWWIYPYDDPKTGKHFDFEWEATVAGRTHGNGCPFLVGQAIWVGFNDLATTNPELAAEWNYEKNAPLKPTEVSESTGKKVWWIYPYDDPKTGKHFDFEWEATVASRTQGNGCPYLVNHEIYVGYNDLYTTNPELAKQWNYKRNGSLKPENVTISSGLEVWWIYPYDDPNTGKHFDFEWKSRIADRTRYGGEACPFITRSKVWEGYNDIATTHPEIAKQWDYEKNGNLKPTQVVIGSPQVVWWKMEYDDPETQKHYVFNWQSKIIYRQNGGCPFLGYGTSYPEQVLFYYISKVFNDARNADRDTINLELDIFIPSIKTAIEYDGFHFHKKRLYNDNIKDSKCKKNQIRLIRIREYGLVDTKYAECICREDNSDGALEKVITNVFELLGNEAPDIDLKRDYLEIKDRYYRECEKKTFVKMEIDEMNY